MNQQSVITAGASGISRAIAGSFLDDGTDVTIIGLMKTLAMEHGVAGVRVDAIIPGAMEDPHIERVVALEGQAQGRTEAEIRALYVKLYVKGVSLRSRVPAQDIADMVHFLASPSGAKVSGGTLFIDRHTETLAP